MFEQTETNQGRRQQERDGTHGRLVTRTFRPACRNNIPLAPIRHQKPTPLLHGGTSGSLPLRAKAKLRHRRQASACSIARRPITHRRFGTEQARRPPKANYADLLDGLKGLGLVNVTAAQVAEAVKKLFPLWEPGSDQSGVLRAVFLHLRRQNTRDNVGEIRHHISPVSGWNP